MPCNEKPKLEKNCPVCKATGVPCLRPSEEIAAKKAQVQKEALGLFVKTLQEVLHRFFIIFIAVRYVNLELMELDLSVGSGIGGRRMREKLPWCRRGPRQFRDPAMAWASSHRCSVVAL